MTRRKIHKRQNKTSEFELLHIFKICDKQTNSAKLTASNKKLHKSARKPGCSNTPNIKTRLDLRRGSLGSENLQHSKCPVLQQNNKLRPRTPHGVRRGHPGGRPEPTGRRLSALCEASLPFEQTKPQRLFDGACWKVGRPRALVACRVSKNWTENVCAFSGLESSQQPEVITAERPKLVRRFSPRCPRRSVALAC